MSTNVANLYVPLLCILGSFSSAQPPIRPCINPSCNSPPCPARLLGDVGCTTRAGAEVYNYPPLQSRGDVIPSNSHIYGPFENGFGSRQRSIIEGWGCTDASVAYDSEGGTDVGLAEARVAHLCNIKLPRLEGQNYVGIVGSCGGHTHDYHFHRSFACVYSETGGHSTEVGDVAGWKMYGKWEDFTNQMLPLLDACGAHVGPTPDSAGATVYHYHVQDKAPFTVGCHGPAVGNKLVSVSACRALYPECNNAAEEFPVGANIKVSYVRFCPCFDANGKNNGVIEELPALNSKDISYPVGGTTTTTTTMPVITIESLCACVTQHSLCDATCNAMFGANISSECKNLYVKGLCSSSPIIQPQQAYKEVCIQQCGNPTSTSTTSTVTTTTTAPTNIKDINSGDTVFLRTRSGTGNYIDVEGSSVQARWKSRGHWQGITIETKNGGTIKHGDTIYLKSHTGAHFDVTGESVQARWADMGQWQSVVLERKLGNGVVQQGDLVCMRAHTGNHLDVVDNLVRARYNECGEWQTMRLQKEATDGIVSGDSIYLEAHTGKLLDVEGNRVQARWNNLGEWETFVIENKIGNAVLIGDTIFLKAHTGMVLDVQGSSVQANWNDYGTWQELVIEAKDGTSAVAPGDSIYLRAHTGRMLDVQGSYVQANWNDMGALQALTMRKFASRRLTDAASDYTFPALLV